MRVRTGIAAVAVLLSAPLVTSASIPSADGTFHGCYLRTLGSLRLIDPPAERCLPRLEVSVSWNQRGLQGPPGEGVVAVPVSPGDPICPAGGTRFLAGGTETYACNGLPGASSGAGTFERYVFAPSACTAVSGVGGGQTHCFQYTGGDAPPCAIVARATSTIVGDEYVCRLDLPRDARIDEVTVIGRAGAVPHPPGFEIGTFKAYLWRTTATGFPTLSRETLASGDTADRVGLDNLPLVPAAGPPTVEEGWDYLVSFILYRGEWAEPPYVRGILIRYTLP